MTAVAAEHPAVAPLPAAGTLSERQLLGIDCARCGTYLGVDAVRLGAAQDHGYLLQLFGCDPPCAPARLPRRRTAPGQPVADAPWRNTPLGRLPRWTAASDGPDPLTISCDASEATMRRVVAGLRALPDTAPARSERGH